MSEPKSPSEFLVISRGQWDADKSREEIQQAIDAFYTWRDRLVVEGKMKSGQRLDTRAKLVAKGGVTDGPFTEAKEVIGGYWFFLAGSLEEASALAAQNPCLACGLSYEVRPIEPERASAFKPGNETPPSWAAKSRPSDTGPVTLREIDSDTVLSVVRLSVAQSQKGFVAPNATSLAQALFAPEAWYRAIYCGNELAGFVMLEDESLRQPPPAAPKVGVWRFMVDAKFQGRGIGRAALQQVIEHVRRKGLFASIELSYVPGPGCPEPFYRGLGFRPTGRIDGAEIVLELVLQEPSATAGTA